MANKYKELALEYCTVGKVDVSNLRKEEIVLILDYVKSYDSQKQVSKVFVPNKHRKFLIDFDSLYDLVNEIQKIEYFSND